MIRRSHNNSQDKRRVQDTQRHEEYLPHLAQTLLAGCKATAEQTRMVQKHGANTERVAKVERGESGELVEELVGGVDGLGVLSTDSVEEAVLFGQKTGRHAWVGGEDDEAEEVGQGHHATGLGELGMRRGGVVVPCKEAVSNAVRKCFNCETEMPLQKHT